MNSVRDTAKSGGLPHSEIPGSTIARISPGLIAACHVLLRLSTPRHSPDALHYLITTPHQRPARMCFLVGYRPSACLSPVSRSQPRLWPVPPWNIQTLRRMQSPTSSMEREPAGITTNPPPALARAKDALSIPCVPNRTTGQHLLLPKKQTILPDRPAVTQSRKTPYDDKQHS